MLKRCFVSEYQYFLLSMSKIDESLFDKLVEMIFNSKENPIGRHVFYIHKVPVAKLLVSDNVLEDNQAYIVNINVEISSFGLIISAVDYEVVKVMQ